MSNYTQKLTISQVDDQTCPATAYQEATVCVPVNVRPFVVAGTPLTFCCGDPIVTSDVTTCNGVPNGSCTFTLTQDICVVVPVEFGARTRVGAPSVECGESSAEDICTDCDIFQPVELPNTGNCPTCKK